MSPGQIVAYRSIARRNYNRLRPRFDQLYLDLGRLGKPELINYHGLRVSKRGLGRRAFLNMVHWKTGSQYISNTAAPYGGICLDFKYMRGILDIHPSDLDVTVQPGLVWTDLNLEVSKHNLFFPPDPGYGATIGGMIATGCSGTNAARYGTIKDGWVLGVVVVLADGSVVRTKGRTKKSSSGYDLTRLMIGSEGTLGIITEATLKLANIPKYSNVIACGFGHITVSPTFIGVCI